jgi:hypothetical protein
MKKIFLSIILITAALFTKAQSDSLSQYVGTFVFPDGSVVPSVEVKLDNGNLSMSSAAGTSALTWLGVDSFTVVEFSGTAVFKRGDDGKIATVHIEAGGYVLDGKKQLNGLWIMKEYYVGIKNE